MGWLRAYIKENHKTIIECAVVLIVLLFIMYMSASRLFDYQIKNTTPLGYHSADSFWHGAYAEYTYDVGTLTQMPPFMI